MIQTMPTKGDIFSYSWGYDQTNIQYYQVIRTTPKMIVMREIEAKQVPGSDTGFMCDKCVPVKDSFLDDNEIRKKVYWYSDVAHVSMDYGCCELWNGKPEGRSFYA